MCSFLLLELEGRRLVAVVLLVFLQVVSTYRVSGNPRLEERPQACAYRRSRVENGGTRRGDGMEGAMTRSDAIDATPPRRHRVTTEEHRGRSTRSEWPQTRKKEHPRPRLMDTSRVDGVKAT